MTARVHLVLRPEFRTLGQEPDTGTTPKLTRDLDGPPPAEQEQTPAGGTGGGGGGARKDGTGMCLDQAPLFLGLIVIFYFLIIRPGQKTEKKRKAMLSVIKKGDQVVTSSGIHGVISSLTDDTVTLRVDRDINLTFDRSTIGRVTSDDATPPAKT